MSISQQFLSDQPKIYDLGSMRMMVKEQYHRPGTETGIIFEHLRDGGARGG